MQQWEMMSLSMGRVHGRRDGENESILGQSRKGFNSLRRGPEYNPILSVIVILTGRHSCRNALAFPYDIPP
jgi:hypothetical protein